MNLSRKLPLAFGLTLLLTLLAGFAGLWTAHRAIQVFHTDVQAQVDQERRTAAMESHFKTQVQEWKNTLLRGSDSQLLDKHWQAFLKEEQEVDGLAKGLQADLQDPALAQLAAAFMVQHQKMAAGYRDGLEKFKSAGLEPSVGDMAVKGIDREAAKLLQELKATIAQHSAEVSQQAYAQGRQAVTWSLGMMLLAAALGVGIGMRISRDVVRPLQTAVAAADAVARGDLRHTVQAHGQDETGRLLGALATMQTQLRRLVQDVRGNAEQVAAASAEIALGNSDLAARTEQQASSLQETASSMEELDGTVQHNAQSAQEASALAARASTVEAGASVRYHRRTGRIRCDACPVRGRSIACDLDASSLAARKGIAPNLSHMVDAKFFQKAAALGTYALEDSPLITAFMRDDTAPSVTLPDDQDD